MRLLRTFLFIVLLHGFAGNLPGQSNKAAIGFEGGPGMAIFYAGSGLYSKSGLISGGSAGIFYQNNLNDVFSIRTSINYERKGTKIHGNSAIVFSQDGYYSVFDYLTLPVVCKATLGRKVKVFFNAGPWFSYLIHQALFYRNNEGNLVKIGEERNSYLPYDVGILVGIGADFPVSKSLSLSVELRNNLGLLNIRKPGYHWENDIYYFEGSYNAYTNSTLLLFGLIYKFPLRK